jgi:hypothetical protein
MKKQKSNNKQKTTIMKKELLLFAAAATMLTACVNMDTIQSVDDYDAPSSIGFSTFTGYQTKAENSSAVKKHSLGTYHQSFKVWSSKYIAQGTEPETYNPKVVFTAQKVNATLTTAAELYDAAGAIAKNATLTGALNSSDELTADQATAYNTAMSPETAKEAGNTLSADEAAAYNATLSGAVAAGDIKTEAVYDWTYSPIVFWDKSATKYDFYAAAPANLAWVWDNTNKKLSLDNFSVDGTTIAASATIDPKAKFGDNDIMISEDITDYSTYTSDPVRLSFIHLLSRLNIGVRKDAVLNEHTVKLKSITVYGLNSNGKFDESLEAATSTTPGGIARWVAPSEGQAKFTEGKGYSTETEVTTDFKYVYQALAIPQTVTYESGILLNGTNATTTSKPYLNISYEIWVNYTAEEAKEYNAALPNALAPGVALTSDQATAYNTAMTGSKNADDTLTEDEAADYNATLTNAVSTSDERMLDDYSYTYNLADMFNGDGSDDDIIFGEGWMNTLKITINPIAIDFDADVYEWAEATSVEVEVPELVTVP